MPRYAPAKIIASQLHKKGTPVQKLSEIKELEEFRPKKYTSKEIKIASKKRTPEDIMKILGEIEKIPREERLRQLLSLGIDERTIIQTLLTNNYKSEHGFVIGPDFSVSKKHTQIHGESNLGRYLYELGFNNPESINKIITDFARVKKINFVAQKVIDGFNEANKTNNSVNPNEFGLKLKNNKYSLDRIVYEIKKAGYNNPTAIGKILVATGHQSMIVKVLAKFGYKSPKHIGEAYGYNLTEMFKDGITNPIFLGKTLKMNVFDLDWHDRNRLDKFIESTGYEYGAKRVFFGKMLYGMGANTPEKLGYAIKQTHEMINYSISRFDYYVEILKELRMGSAKEYGAFIKGKNKKWKEAEKKGYANYKESYNMGDLWETEYSGVLKISDNPKKLADYLIGGGFGAADFCDAYVSEINPHSVSKIHTPEFLGKMYASVNANPSKVLNYLTKSGKFSKEDISKIMSGLKKKT